MESVWFGRPATYGLQVPASAAEPTASSGRILKAAMGDDLDVLADLDIDVEQLDEAHAAPDCRVN